MAPVKDLLALGLGGLHGAVWAVYMVALVLAGDRPGPDDWAILPAGVTALMATLALTERVYQPQHRRREE